MTRAERTLTSHEAAKRLNRSVRRLAEWRALGQGPAYLTNPTTGRFIGYLESDVVAWQTRGRVETKQ